MSYLATFAASLVVVPLVMIAIARMFRPDTNIFFIWLNAYTFWIYLPAYPALALAGWMRRWLLVPPALLVCALHLWWVFPDYAGASAIPPEAENAPQLRLVTANALFDNPSLDEYAAELASHEPDVLFLQEYGRPLAAALDRAGLRDELPHFREAFAPGWQSGIAVYSRYPLEDVDVEFVTRRPVIRADILVDGEPLRLFNVHSISPGGRWTASPWNAGWEQLVEIFEAETAPFLIAGDFNMTQHHRWYRALEDLGLKNCHEERGRGNATTWPDTDDGLYRFLPPIRIDHVFVSEGVVCTGIAEGKSLGSDHRPVIADIAVLP